MPPTSLPFTIVTDGKLMWENLRLSGYDAAWLRGVLREKQVDLRDLFLLSVDNLGRVVAIRKEEQ